MNKFLFLLLSCIIAQGSVCAMEEESMDMVKSNPLTMLRITLWGDHVEQLKVRLLSNNWANINCQNDQSGESLLNLAIRIKAEESAKFLVNRGANVNLQDHYGWAPLHVAAYYGCETVVKLLLDKGADLSLKNEDGYTPLGLAAHWHREGIIQLVNKWTDIQAISALAMGLQKRVGKDSPVNLPGIDASIIQNIAQNLFQ